MGVPASKNLKSWVTSLLNSPFLFVFLAGLYPAVFKIAKNWFLLKSALSSESLFLLVTPPVFALIVSFTIYCALALLLRGVKSTGTQRPERLTADHIKITVCSVTSCLLLVLFFDLTLRSALMTLTGYLFTYRDLYLFAGLVMAPLMIYYALKVGTKFLSLIFLTLIFVSFSELAYNFITNVHLTAGQAHDQRQFISVNNKSEKRFTSKPNVYLIVPDSYTNSAVLEKILKFDNTSFRQHLQDRKFRLYDNAYSNYYGTLASMQSVFSMQHHYYRHAAGFFDSYIARRILGADLANPVISTFKHNGYDIRYIHDTNYECPNPGNMIDYYTAYKKDSLKQVFYPRFMSLVMTTKIKLLGQRPNKLIPNQNKRLADVQTAISSNRPFFMYVHIDSPNHAPDLPYEKLDFFEQSYSKKLQDTNHVISELIGRIVEKDPGAFIIVSGDHGPFRFNDLWKSTLNMNDQAPVTQDLLAMDLYGIILAIRFPEGYDGRFNSSIISPVNLFRHVFAVLRNDDEILLGREKDESYALAPGQPLHIAVRDGSPLNHWVVYDRPITKPASTSHPNGTPSNTRKP